jgi:sec-independent protein translocase protein TatC
MPLDQIDVDSWDDASEKKESDMSFLDHLEELRWHIIRSLIAVIACMIAAFFAKDFIFNTVIFGPKNADFITYRAMCGLADWLQMPSLCAAPPKFDLSVRALGEKFNIHLQASFFIGLIVSIPYIFWEIWRFISPGLYEKEQKAVRGIVFICSLLFFTGVLFGYYVIAPFAISFLAGYDLGDIQEMPTIASYVDYMVMFTLPMGMVFELPIVIYFMSKMGIVTPTAMREGRRYAIVLILLIAGIITPTPDIVTQLLVATPLYFLYELSIGISGRVLKQQRQDAAMS